MPKKVRRKKSKRKKWDFFTGFNLLLITPAAFSTFSKSP
jgi:hypothetical protein